ncbi:MAG: DUF2142 domain-containing protein [Methanobrevibacter sp.]|jgi:uncharacterized membrane protein|nr:DUF2142 domain-containing protein [Methanobrevibacter sp.]
MNKIDDIKVEAIFLVFCLIFGSIFAMINPPFMAPDEGSHFIKAFDVSQGNFISENPIKIPKSFSIPGVIDQGSLEKRDVESSKKINYTSYFNSPLNIEHVQESYTSAISYMPLPYLGTAFVIKVGELFNTSPLLLMYFGRLINLLIYAIIVYFSIKIVPIGKYVLLLLALMPMSLYVASSISTDSLNLALSFFAICLFLNLAFKKDKIRKKYIILVSILLLCLVLSKQIYALLGLLFFIIPKSKFDGLKSRLFFFISIFSPSIIVSISLNFLFKISNLLNGLVYSSNSSSVTNQLILQDILWNKLIFVFDLLNIIINSIITWFNQYIITFVGCFGWSVLDNPLPLFLVYLYLIILVVVSILDVSKFKLSYIQKIIFLLICFLESMILFIIAWNWTPTGFKLIYGVQGRYFIPFAPLIFLTLQNNKISHYIGRKSYSDYLSYFIIGFIIIMLSISSYILYHGYFLF